MEVNGTIVIGTRKRVRPMQEINRLRVVRRLNDIFM
jgi:hypothetical protein